MWSWRGRARASNTSMSAAAWSRLRRLADRLRIQRQLPLQEYANDVVYHIQNVCDEAQIRTPTIVTESGRAVVRLSQRAGVSACLASPDFPKTIKAPPLPAEPEQPLIDLQETIAR